MKPLARKIDRFPDAVIHPGKSATKQSFKNECDINNIMAKYQKTGAVTHANDNQGEYGFATSEDFTSAMQTVTRAQQLFDGLPSSIRSKFHNNPEEFLEFTQDESNDEEAYELGLNPDYVPQQKETPSNQPETVPEVAETPSSDE